MTEDPHHAAWLEQARSHLRNADPVLARLIDDRPAIAGYVGSSVPACSAIMQLAYRSGQFASAWPVRSSCSPWAASARRPGCYARRPGC